MGITKSVEEIIAQHVVFEIEFIDRMYCNLYMGILQTTGGIAHFFIKHRKNHCATSFLMGYEF